MFFSYAARIVAVLAFLFGLYDCVTGLLIANGAIGPADQALARYLPASPTTGAAIDKGIYAILFAVALGVMAEISFSLRRTKNLT